MENLNLPVSNETETNQLSNILKNTRDGVKQSGIDLSDTPKTIHTDEVFVQMQKAVVAPEIIQEEKYRIESLTSAELADEKIQEISDFYRYIFANSFGQYLFYPSIGKPISPQEVFGLKNNQYASLEQLDSFSLEDFPIHPQTGEQAIFWIDPEITFQNLKHKLGKDAQVSLLKENQTDKICGFIFAHKCTVKEEFQSEEWENPFYYSKLKDKNYYRDFDDYLKKLNEALFLNKDKFKFILGKEVKLHPDSEIYAWNTIATDPSAQKSGKVLEMSKEFFKLVISEMQKDMIVIGEAQYQSTAHSMFKTAGHINILNILKKGKLEKNDPIISVGNLFETAKIFSLSMREFVKLKKRQEKLKYEFHLMDNPKVIVEEILEKNRGVFAKEDIKIGEIIAIFDGPIYTAKKLSDLKDRYIIDHVIQIGEKEYLDHKEGLAAIANHSCDPNCGIKDRVKITAMRDIKKGEEITWDYEMSEDSDWEMKNCQCGSPNCRDTIRAFRFMPEEVRKKYQGFISDWLVQKYNFNL